MQDFDWKPRKIASVRIRVKILSEMSNTEEYPGYCSCQKYNLGFWVALMRKWILVKALLYNQHLIPYRKNNSAFLFHNLSLLFKEE